MDNDGLTDCEMCEGSGTAYFHRSINKNRPCWCYYSYSMCNHPDKKNCKMNKVKEDERMCYHCNGSGKLTWLENIFGKNENG
jgi:hypothetical protein